MNLVHTTQRPKKIAIIAHGEIGNELWEELVKDAAADEIVVWNRAAPTEQILPEDKPTDRFSTDKYKLAQLRIDQAAIIKARRRDNKNTSQFRFTHNIQEALEGAEIVAVTAGIPRKDGMKRKDLLKTNCEFIDPFAMDAKKYAPSASYIIATNPVDTLTQRFHDVSGIPSDQVVGLSGELDYARLVQSICFTLHVAPSRVINAHVIGQHADTMFPVFSNIKIVQDDGSEKKLSDYSDAELSAIRQNTVKGGSKLIGFGKKSDFMGPSAALREMIDLIVQSKGISGKSGDLQCSSLREAEGEPNVFIGRTGHYENGKFNPDPIHKLLGTLSDKEKEQWHVSVKDCQESVNELPAIPGKHAAQVTASKGDKERAI